MAKLDLGISCSIPLPLGVASLGSGCCSRPHDVTPTPSCMNVTLGNSLALVSSSGEALWVSPYLGSLVPVSPNINTLAGIHFSLGILENIFYGLGMCGLFVKVLSVIHSEHLPLYKKEYNGTLLRTVAMFTKYLSISFFPFDLDPIHVHCSLGSCWRLVSTE